MIKFTSTEVAVPLVWSRDPAIDDDSSDRMKYAQDPSSVASTIRVKDGQAATIFHARPLSSNEHIRVLQQAAVSSSSGAPRHTVRSLENVAALHIAIEKIENVEVQGDVFEGEAAKNLVAALPLNVSSDVGGLIISMSSAGASSSPFGRVVSELKELRTASRRALEWVEKELPPAGRSPEAHAAILRLQECIHPGSTRLVHPESEAPELGK